MISLNIVDFYVYGTDMSHLLSIVYFYLYMYTGRRKLPLNMLYGRQKACMIDLFCHIVAFLSYSRFIDQKFTTKNLSYDKKICSTLFYIIL